ncbi:ABC transporter substrate-binding protein [Saliterribacillus persicus]|uniref:Iron complex transport system substrate-binding protein n=1 Tax=Saliterribacillus persicus TaxID=930114 RepID=A0A368Y9S3_9BACI|nr:iron-siderophore ABC transporter substrate-binding protein [Saliterribacillus persicus]RCW76865.1 iron complex transport system substrate-binding protein [Saliterribacillus persicus]
MTKFLFRKNIFNILTILLLSMLLLAACGNEDNESQANEEEENDTVATDSNEEEETANTREVEHAMGTTTIEGKPERIVTLYQGATDAAVAFGITPVGAVESWLQQPFYDYLKDDLTDVTVVGQETQPNLEEIANLKPDLIIASNIRHEEIYDQLSAIAPTVSHETVYAFKETVSLMGEAMGEEEKATEILDDWNNRVEDFKGKVEEKYQDEWPFHASVLNFRADHARIYVTGFAGSILSELGFKGPKQLSDDSQDVLKLTDKESITEMNADVFYLFMEDDPAVESTYKEWTEHPLWKDLDAVKNDEVHQVDEIIWNMAGGIKAANLMLDDLYDRFDLEK